MAHGLMSQTLPECPVAFLLTLCHRETELGTGRCSADHKGDAWLWEAGLSGLTTRSISHPKPEALDHAALRKCWGPRKAVTLCLKWGWRCLSREGTRL